MDPELRRVREALSGPARRRWLALAGFKDLERLQFPRPRSALYRTTCESAVHHVYLAPNVPRAVFRRSPLVLPTANS